MKNKIKITGVMLLLSLTAYAVPCRYKVVSVVCNSGTTENSNECCGWAQGPGGFGDLVCVSWSATTLTTTDGHMPSCTLGKQIATLDAEQTDGTCSYTKSGTGCGGAWGPVSVDSTVKFWGCTGSCE